jgi:release factor glutamine methyltransferase
VRPSDVLRRGADYLERHGVESPGASAEALLADVLGTDRAGLYARREGLSSAEARAFGRALCQRCSGVPLQHLTGRQAFRRLDLVVRPGVFVPRPETEVVVEAALAQIARLDGPLVADAGTGTGAIALSIASEHPGARVFATDLSADAVGLARENAGRHGLEVEVLEGDLLDPLPPRLRGRLDLVVSNPPYVTAEEYAGLPPEVRADPELALLGGTEVHARLARQAAGWLRPGGALVVEIGSAQGGEVGALLARAGFREVGVLPDLAGRDRVVAGRLA